MQRVLYILVMLSTLFALPVVAQNDTIVQSEKTPVEDYSQVKGLKLKPRLGIGLGTMVFYGDIGRDNAGYHAGSADLAYTLDITNELTSYLDLRLYTVFSTITLNELSNPRHFNMQSQVRSGGALLSYNFDHFLPADRGAEPFVGIGFEAFEFLSKTDLYDANGMRYHYWTDGTIRNIDQSAANANEAIMLQRDYVYETDLRELNRDGFGSYPERSFAIPVGAGVQFKVTDRFRARIGATYHFTLTDLVDNLTAESNGNRKGDSRNDRFLFSSFTLNYDLNPLGMKQPKINPEFLDEDGNLLAGLEDTDLDGVPDVVDECPGTEEGVTVTAKGCPQDSDGDGFPDHLDKEPNSLHTYVNGEGIAMDDDEIYERYLMWNDSIPWKGETTFEDYAQVLADASKAKMTYRVRIPRDASLAQEDINALLAIPDVHTVEQDGQRYFVVGNYDELPDAVRRQLQLIDQGFDSDLVEGSRDSGYAEVETDPELEARIAAELADEQASVADGTEELADDLHFRVQVGAFSREVPENIFADMGDVISVKGADGLIRYVTQSYTSMDAAAERRIELLMQGFDGAFITAYEAGDRIKLKDAGMTVRDESKDLLVDQENNSIDPDAVFFRVRLGVFAGDIPTETLDKMLSFGGVRPRRLPDGTTAFISSPIDQFTGANEMLKKASELGLGEAIIIGEFNGQFLSAEEARHLKEVGDEQVMLSE
jgi:cell division protein FtsN